MQPTRRQAIATLLAGTAALKAAAQPFPFTGLDHIEFTVSNLPRSLDFYAKLFGPILKNAKAERRYQKVGISYLAFEPNPQVRVDHFSVGIENYDIAKIHAYLTAQNIPYRDFPSGKDLNVTDPDGMRLQLSVDNGWTALPQTVPEPLSVTTPTYQPAGIDHILLNVSDPAKSTAFYEKILGSSTRNNNVTWFQLGRSRLGLAQSSNPGVASYALKSPSATPQTLRDPDNYQIQITP